MITEWTSAHLKGNNYMTLNEKSEKGFYVRGLVAWAGSPVFSTHAADTEVPSQKFGPSRLTRPSNNPMDV